MKGGGRKSRVQKRGCTWPDIIGSTAGHQSSGPVNLQDGVVVQQAECARLNVFNCINKLFTVVLFFWRRNGQNGGNGSRMRVTGRARAA